MISQETPSTNQNTEADVCDACGTIVELGSVIVEDDTLLVLPFIGADQASVDTLTEKYISAAKQRFPEVVVSVEYQETAEQVEGKLSLQFECTAEKLIYEMNLSAL